MVLSSQTKRILCQCRVRVSEMMSLFGLVLISTDTLVCFVCFWYILLSRTIYKELTTRRYYSSTPPLPRANAALTTAIQRHCQPPQPVGWGMYINVAIFYRENRSPQPNAHS